MSKQTMSEIVAAYNALAAEQGKEEVNSFKNLAAARAALASLESDTMTDAPDEVTPDPDREIIPESSNSGPKYNTTGKRGPTQGIGAFCKGMIADGKTNEEILEAVATDFPTAKTTRNCVAYYRAKMKAATPVEASSDEVTEEEVAS